MASEKVLDPEANSFREKNTFKLSKTGVRLVPQPSDDDSDPLNWPTATKITNLAIVTIASFAGITQAQTNQSGYSAQAPTYHVTILQASYSISAADVGLALGPFFAVVLSSRVGPICTIFWGITFCLACNVWSALMTGANDYDAFVVSRALAGTFGSWPSVVGATMILDTFFLHQRGKALACFTIASLFAVQFSPTMGGFIVQHSTWPVQFWWTVGLLGVVVMLTLTILRDTKWSTATSMPSTTASGSRVLRRVKDVFFGRHSITRDGTPTSGAAILFITLCPVTIAAGLILLLSFGWIVGVSTLVAVFLQTPRSEGGYEFSSQQTSLFTFCAWIGIFGGEALSHGLNDRVPLWWCRHYGKGRWKPEYRLYPLLLVPTIVVPLALGIFGAALQYHLHYMVLALGTFLLQVPMIFANAIIFTYVIECFNGHNAEVFAALNFYRLSLGVTIPFFIEPWAARVGEGWVFGTMAFLSIVAFSIGGFLAWKGPRLRQMSFKRLKGEEEEISLM